MWLSRCKKKRLLFFFWIEVIFSKFCTANKSIIQWRWLCRNHVTSVFPNISRNGGQGQHQALFGKRNANYEYNDLKGNILQSITDKLGQLGSFSLSQICVSARVKSFDTATFFHFRGAYSLRARRVKAFKKSKQVFQMSCINDHGAIRKCE